MAAQPNILIIWGDDIGISNLSCYSDGLMGYRTPNIDRIAAEGVRFTDYYGEQSCTAGRADITSNTYYDWVLDHAWAFVPAQAYVAQMIQSLVDFPRRQEPASFNLDRLMEKLKAGIGSS